MEEKRTQRRREKGEREKVGSYGCVVGTGMGRAEERKREKEKSGVGESTGCFIMQKLSRQLGRSGSAPLHYPSSRRAAAAAAAAVAAAVYSRWRKLGKSLRPRIT